jgi:glutamate--cysteine ligase
MTTKTQAHSALESSRILGIRRGIEKESLRVRSDGTLADSPHPLALGSALTHPHITTDFSESQVELITGVHGDISTCLQELREVHQFTERALGEDMLWVSSMPCDLPQDEAIPLGQYGSSNVGRAKTVYRMGLGHRYGRRMQTISGIHYNWSMPDVSSDAYFGLIRNFRRNAFVLMYLFGASPTVCSSFVAGREHRLQKLSDDTLYLPHATSLRMGRLGYQSDAQASLAVSYNSLKGYGDSLEDALTRNYPAYEAIGVRGEDGQYRQLATTLLQIENEFYGTIRPKRVIRPGERPLHALRQRGVEYVEVRLMDLNPFEALGIHAQTLRFLDLFLSYCLVSESPSDTPQEIAAIANNQHLVAERGREPGLQLQRGDSTVSLLDWGQEVVLALRPLADQFDAAHGGRNYSDAVDAAMQGFSQPQTLPSARVIESVQREHGGSFAGFVKAQSERTKMEMLESALGPQALARLEQQADESIRALQAIEAADTVPFDAYLQDYLAFRQLLA